jgi:hypothetical protein
MFKNLSITNRLNRKKHKKKPRFLSAYPMLIIHWEGSWVKGSATIDTDKMIVEIDLMNNATYIVKDGVLTIVDTPPRGFGKQVINWQNGKPTHFDVNYTNKL